VGIRAERATQFVIPEGQRIREGLLFGCSSLAVVLSVLDVVSAHDFYLAQISILFPLKLRLSNEDMRRAGGVRLENRLF
jgi:hypothetical protein